MQQRGNRALQRPCELSVFRRALGKRAHAHPTSLCHWIKTAQEWIHAELIARGEYCIPDFLDGTEED